MKEISQNSKNKNFKNIVYSTPPPPHLPGTPKVSNLSKRKLANKMDPVKREFQIDREIAQCNYVSNMAWGMLMLDTFTYISQTTKLRAYLLIW